MGKPVGADDDDSRDARRVSINHACTCRSSDAATLHYTTVHDTKPQRNTDPSTHGRRQRTKARHACSFQDATTAKLIHDCLAIQCCRHALVVRLQAANEVRGGRRDHVHEHLELCAAGQSIVRLSVMWTLCVLADGDRHLPKRRRHRRRHRLRGPLSGTRRRCRSASYAVHSCESTCGVITARRRRVGEYVTAGG
jgi:hypothetical protein